MEVLSCALFLRDGSKQYARFPKNLIHMHKVPKLKITEVQALILAYPNVWVIWLHSPNNVFLMSLVFYKLPKLSYI